MLRWWAAVATAAALALTAGAEPARAEDQKVAIGNYQWTPSVVHVDLGQHVTWYWVGPDTMHSVTGVSANDLGIDSDPNTSEPMHALGSTFTVTFTVPGVYQFQCKLHPIVHGTVIVSAIPGNPDDDPEPVPPLNTSITSPTIESIFLRPRAVTDEHAASLHFSLDQVASVDAEIWHAGPGGRRGRYAGWQRFGGHIGFNQVAFAGPSAHFRPRPGRYVVFLTATDAENNASAPARLRFRISAPAGGRARAPTDHARRDPTGRRAEGGRDPTGRARVGRGGAARSSPRR